MKHNKGSSTLIILLVIFLALLAYFYWSRSVETPASTPVISTTTTPSTPKPTTQTPQPTTSVATNSSCGLTITSHKPNDRVDFPLTLSGKIDNTNAKKLGCAWTMFEGQAGMAQLYYYTKNSWQKLGEAAPIKVANWMTNSTTFTTTLNFEKLGVSLQAGSPIKVILTEDNASGEPPIDTFSFQLIYK